MFFGRYNKNFIWLACIAFVILALVMQQQQALAADQLQESWRLDEDGDVIMDDADDFVNENAPSLDLNL